MKLSERLPPIPFKGNWRWKVKPYSGVYVKLCLQTKPAFIWLPYTSDLVDPFTKLEGFTVEDRARSLLSVAEHRLVRNSTTIISFKDGNKDAR